MFGNKEGRRKFVTIWRRQKGHCSVCIERITADTEWFAHYIESRIDGGKDNLTNLTLVHKNCHKG